MMLFSGNPISGSRSIRDYRRLTSARRRRHQLSRPLSPSAFGMAMLAESAARSRRRARMDAMESTSLYALASISSTFVGFSALIMMVRQTLGDGLSELAAWITRTFVQLGFLVTAGAMTPPLLALCGFSDDFIWRLRSGVIGAIMLIFVATYPTRRRAVAGKPALVFVYLDLFLLLGPITILALNVGGRNVTELPLGRDGGLYEPR
jgi:hypothetical protein